MGQVFRATDTKLGRDVALKILPPSFTTDPERVARFRREAQVLASLNHPHIAQIYGLEAANDTQVLVLELVDGETLDKRIARGPIPAEEALAIAAQFAVATNGSLVYLPGPADAKTDTRLLGLFDRNGGRTAVPTPAADINHPRVSPDGKRVAFAIDDDTSSEIRTYELGGATAVRRLTFGGQNRFPIWTSDGERIVFQSDRDGDRGIYWQRADGASAAERVTKAGPGDAHIPEAWSSRGDGFLFRIVRGLTHTLQFYSLSQKEFVPFGGIESRAPTDAARDWNENRKRSQH
jgi:dipeptidyl aminopeptidase/acylaminoacyl peptidase